jgi:hypothetical protein
MPTPPCGDDANHPALPSPAPPIHLSWVMLSQPAAWKASAIGAWWSATLGCRGGALELRRFERWYR